jgi:lipoprotein-anchoring transpeptidase ErfK/SrfK
MSAPAIDPSIYRGLSSSNEERWMLDRRTFLIAAAAALVSSDESVAVPAWFKRTVRPRRSVAKRKPKRSRPFKLDPKYEPQRVAYGDGVYPPGSIVIDPESRLLYFIEDEKSATRYGVGVGRAGMSLRGTAYVARKAKWPSWTPTPSMIRREPRYARYAGGMRGGPHNPLGARALYLYRSKNDTMYRIHGTNQPRSIGQAMSSGCVRMMNAHVEQLYDKVGVGALVVILGPA